MQRYEWYGFMFGVVAVIAFLLAAYMRLKTKPEHFGDLQVTRESPNRKYTASIYKIGSSAVSPDVFILRLKEKDHAFAADNAVFSVRQDCKIDTIDWSGGHTLAVKFIDYGSDACTVKPSYHWRGVTVKTASRKPVLTTAPPVAEREKK